MTKHSPGPWHCEGPDCFGDFNIIPAVTSLAIGAVVQNGFRSAEETAANAHLVGASSDLYEAIVMVRDADNDCKADGLPTILPAARAKIDAAIAKAEGRSNG